MPGIENVNKKRKEGKSKKKRAKKMRQKKRQYRAGKFIIMMLLSIRDQKLRVRA